MDVQEEIEKVRFWQNISGGYSDLALENIQNCPFLFIKHLKETEIILGDTIIEVKLIPKKTLSGWFYRTFFKKTINAQLNLLARYIYYWVPKTPVLPKIQFSWKYD